MSYQTGWGFSGSDQTWVVPPNISGSSVTVNLRGAASGRKIVDGSYDRGGRGGTVVGTLAVAAGDVLKIEVGGVGQTVHTSVNKTTRALGGWPDGGDGGVVTGNSAANPLFGGPGGGGSSRIWKSTDGGAHYTLVAVVGGAGASTGDGGNPNDSAYLGGSGGGTTGGSAGQTESGKGGTQSAGGASGSGSGGQISSGATPGSGSKGGKGADVQSPTTAICGGGGGGGYFCGGGGSTRWVNQTNANGGGGGGGSSYVGGLATVIQNTLGTADVDAAGSINIVYTFVPNAPASLAPANNKAFDSALALPISWVFSDPDAGDTQTRADVRWRQSGTTAWNTINNAATTAQAYSFTAGLFVPFNGQFIEWQVRTYDSTATGPWSDSAFIAPRLKPDTLVYNPTPTITTKAPTITGARALNANIRGYQIQVTNDIAGSAGSTVFVDTSVVLLPAVVQSLSVHLPTFNYVNGTSYHIRTRIENPSNVWSDWTDSGALVANVNAPLQPTLAITPNNDTASATVGITNPTSDPHPPIFNNLYRTDTTTSVEELIRTGLALNATATDWTVGFNRSYRYRAEAVASNGAVTSST